jgi:hypothetical protein
MPFQLLRLAVLAAVVGLNGCAAPYAAYSGNDAARLRLRVDEAGFLGVQTGLSRVVGDQCTGISGPRLSSFKPLRAEGVPSHIHSTSSAGYSQGPELTYPRAGMVGSMPANDPRSAEFSLAPGQYVVGLTASVGNGVCSLGFVITTQAGAQYELRAYRDSLTSCSMRAFQWDEGGSGAVWRPVPVTSLSVCGRALARPARDRPVG